MGSQLSTKTSISTASKEDNMDQYLDHIIQKKNKIDSITPSNKITSDFCPSFSYCSYNHFFKTNWLKTFSSRCQHLKKSFLWAKSSTTKLLETKYSKNDEFYQKEVIWLVDTENMFEEKELLYANDFSNKSSFSLLSLDLSIKMNDHSQKTEKKEENEEIMLFYAKPRKLSIDERNSTILRIEELNASNDFSTHNELNDLSFPTKFINYENNILITDEIKKINGKNEENKKKFEKCESIYRIIEKHLNTKDNSLCILKEYYMNYFINKYENLLSSDYRLQKNKEWLDKYEFMILDFRQFISLFQESITLFYDLENISKSLSLPENFFSSDNLINFLLNIMFNEEIYYILFEVQRKIDRFDEIMFRRSLKLVKNYTFDRFLIPEKYFLKNSKISPYSESINIIKNIGFIKSPTHKMRLIIQASELIEKQMIFSSKNNEITSEDYLAILSYVISKSKVTNLISQLNLMEKFLTKTNLTEKNGNFFYMMKAASEYLLNIGIDE